MHAADAGRPGRTQLLVCVDNTDKDAHGKAHKLLLPPADLAHVSAADLPDREHGTPSSRNARPLPLQVA